MGGGDGAPHPTPPCTKPGRPVPSLPTTPASSHPTAPGHVSPRPVPPHTAATIELAVVWLKSLYCGTCDKSKIYISFPIFWASSGWKH